LFLAFASYLFVSSRTVFIFVARKVELQKRQKIRDNKEIGNKIMYEKAKRQETKARSKEHIVD